MNVLYIKEVSAMFAKFFEKGMNLFNQNPEENTPEQGQLIEKEATEPNQPLEKED